MAITIGTSTATGFMDTSVRYWNKIWSRDHEHQNIHHKRIWRELVKRGVLEGNIVDLGCGLCTVYEGKEISLVGVDQSEVALKEAKKRYPHGVYIKADVRKTGLPSGQFDIVVMLGLLDYFPDWTPVLTEARRLLKPQGKIVATLLNGCFDHDWTKYPQISDSWRLYEETKWQ